MFNNTDIPNANVVNGAGGTPEWSTKTPQEILDDVNNAASTMIETSKGKEVPNRLLLPIAQHNYISSTPRSTTSDTTILQYLVNNCYWLASVNDVIPCDELNGSGSGGSDEFVIYNASPDKMALEIVDDVRFHPPERHRLSWDVICTMFYSGLHVYYPLSVRIMDNI